MHQISSNTAESTPAQNYQVEPWREVASGINSGAYAVLLAIAVVYVLTRQAIGKAWVNNFETLESLRQTAEKNSQSIKQFADSQAKLVDYLIMVPGEPRDPKMLLKYLSSKEGGVDEPTEKETK